MKNKELMEKERPNRNELERRKKILRKKDKSEHPQKKKIKIKSLSHLSRIIKKGRKKEKTLRS